MKEQVQKTGVRKWAGQDLVDLQHEPLAAITAFFEEYGSCVIRGCDVIPTGNTNTVTPGMVALEGVDQNGQPTFKVAPFAGVEGVTLPIYLTLTYSTLERPYADLKVKPIAYDFRAAATGVRPTDKPYLEVGVAGGKSFVDAIQDAKHRFFTDTERNKLTSIEANANNYVHPAKHPASMIEQDDQNRMVSTTKMGEWDAKATTAYVAQQIAALVASSPAALDTLNELATALGNDPNFATTVMNALAGKAPSSHKHGLESLTGLDKAMVDGSRRLLRGDSQDDSYWLAHRWMAGKGWRLEALNGFSDNQQGIHRVLVDEADCVTNGVYTTDDVMVSRAEVSTNNSDWNDVVKAGVYAIVGNGTWIGSVNSPVDAYMYGMLCVFTNGRIVTQLYVTHSYSQIWVRSKFNTADWQGWRHIVDSEALSSYATIEHVRQKIADLVGSSPAALDTLNELATALGNDPNFATTVMNALANKAAVNHNHDDNYQPKGNYLTASQLEACFPSGAFSADGSKKEHFLDVICAGSVKQTCEIKDYWGSNNINGYPFNVMKVSTGVYRIIHDSSLAYYGVVVTCRNVDSSGEMDNYATVLERKTSYFEVNTFNGSGSRIAPSTLLCTDYDNTLHS